MRCLQQRQSVHEYERQWCYSIACTVILICARPTVNWFRDLYNRSTLYRAL